MPRKKRRRGKGLGTVYRRGQMWSIAWVINGAKLYEHGYPDEDTARRVLAVKIGDIAAGRGGLKKPKPSGPLAGLVEEWLKVRRTTHRAADQDENRWNNHLAPFLGRYSPDDVDVGMLKKIVAVKLGEGLIARHGPSAHAAGLDPLLGPDRRRQGDEESGRMLPKKTRALIRPTYDPKKTPFVERKKDIARIYQALPAPFNVAFAISALAGLRPGEVRALKWSNVDLSAPAHLRARVGERPDEGQGQPRGADRTGAARAAGRVEEEESEPIQRPRVSAFIRCAWSSGAGPRRHYLGEHRMTSLIKKACKKLRATGGHILRGRAAHVRQPVGAEWRLDREAARDPRATRRCW